MPSRRAMENARKYAKDFDDTPRARKKPAEKPELNEETVLNALKDTSDDVETAKSTKSTKDTDNSTEAKKVYGFYDDPNDTVLTVKLPNNLLKALDLFLVDTKEKRLSNGIRTGGKRTTYLRRLLTKELVQNGYYAEKDSILESG